MDRSQKIDAYHKYCGHYQKLVKEGKVGVLVSPRYGSDFSASWGVLPDDARLVELVLKKEYQAAADLCYELYDVAFNESFFSTLQVEWIALGTKYRIEQYDGAEWVEEYNEEDWTIA